MSVIPQNVIDGWVKQYNTGSELWAKYPDMIPLRDELLDRIQDDKKVIRNFAFRGAKETKGTPIYKAVMGPPLAGKSTLLGAPDRFVKIDPDVWGLLKCMPNTYEWLLNDIGPTMGKTGKDAQIFAYDVARPASNFLTLECMNEAVDRRLNIAHGTTGTSPYVSNLFEGLKKAGYKIDLALLWASDETRESARQHRENKQGIYQATPEDVRDKGLMFPQRFKDYFDYADSIELFWCDKAQAGAKLALRVEGGSITKWDTNLIEKYGDMYQKSQDSLEQQSIPLPPFSLMGQHTLGTDLADVERRAILKPDSLDI